MSARYLIAIFCVTLSLLGTGPSWAVQEQNPAVIMLPQKNPEQAIGLYAQVFVDQSGKDQIEQILKLDPSRWHNSESKRFNFGISTAAYWFRLKFHNGSPKAEQYILEVANARLSEVDFYRLAPGSKQIGDELHLTMDKPLNARPIPHRYFQYSLPFTAEESSTLYIRVASNSSLHVPIFVYTPLQLNQVDRHRMLFQGFYFGAIVIMILYNLFVYLMVRDRSYILYSAFMLALSTFLAVDKGLAFEFLWSHSPWWDQKMYIALIAIGAGLSVAFTDDFLQLKINAPRFHHFFRYLIAIWIILTIATFIFKPAFVILAELLVVIPGGTALLLSGILMWRKGVPAAPFYTIAWVSLINGCFIYALALIGLIPDGALSEYAFQVTHIIEATLLSLGLAYRIKMLDRESQQARASEKAKTEFLANMSHEIRTPMNGVLGMAQLMGQTTLTKQQQSYLSTILSSGNALLNILNDILDHSKIEAGKLEVERIRFPIRHTLEEAASIFSLRAAANHLQYYLWISPDVPEQYEGDPTRIKQILSNYLSNAFKFTTSGKVVIRCRIGITEGKPSLIIEVIDSGIGIPVEKQKLLFSSFTQASTSIAREFGGTGLGLSICKSLAQLMGGQVGLVSEQGKGSCFWLKIPLQESETAKGNTTELRNKKFHLVSQSQLLQDALKEYQTYYQFELTCSEELDDDHPYECDELLIDMSGHSDKELQQAIIKLQNATITNANTTIFIKPSVGETQRTELEKHAQLQELPLAIEHFFQNLIGSPTLCQAQTEFAQTNDENSRFTAQMMVVEDNEVNQKVIQGFLKKCGVIDCDFASSGEAALQHVQRKTPDLIFMDCDLPGIDGYKTTEIIRNMDLPKRPTIVALSAHAFGVHKDRCFSAGMDDHLTKPLVLDELARILDRYAK